MISTAEKNIAPMHHAMSFQGDNTTVPAAGNTVLLTLKLDGQRSRVLFELENTGASNALDVALIEARLHPNGAWFTWISAAQLLAGIPVPGSLIQVVTDPTTLAALGKSRIMVDVTTFSDVRISVSAAAGGTTARARGVATVG